MPSYRHSQPRFNATKEYVARRPFRFNGKQYHPGEPFPVRYQIRRALQMYDRRFIRLADIQPEREPVPVEPAEAPGEAPEPAEAPGEAYTLEVKPGGWYNVLSPAGGAVNERSLRKDEAEALLESLKED